MTFLNHAFSEAQITYRWHCAAPDCRANHTESRLMRRGDEVYLATVPNGWTQVETDFFCPQHRIELLIDGKGFGPPVLGIRPA